jgi:hypothetical protein
LQAEDWLREYLRTVERGEEEGEESLWIHEVLQV